jgi:hypothetical protein
MILQLQFDSLSKVYAAKLFYNLGTPGDVSPDENLKHLKEELLRQLVIQSAVTAFAKAAEELKVSVYSKKTHSIA